MEERHKADGIPITRRERYASALEDAQNELQAVTARIAEVEAVKRELEQRTIQLQTKIEVLTPICHELEEEDIERDKAEWADLATCGIQECCYRVLVEEDRPMTAISIRFALEDRGVNLGRYANPLAIIHTSLGRIPDRVRSFKRKERVGEDQSRVASVRYYEAIRNT